jgi:hypothetical protein
MSNDFLDDIAEESYSDALAYGNLKPKVRDELERFHSDGYFAAIHVCRCKNCGTITRTLGGIFHKETGTKGSSRSIALHLGHTPNLPLLPTDKPVTYLGSTTQVCVACVTAYGFSLDPEAETRSIA